MSVQLHPRLTPEDYLALERATDSRSEYYDGRVNVLSGDSYRHVMIVGNLAFAARNAIGKRPCTVAASALRVRVSPAGLHAYPDVVVVSGEPAFADGSTDTLLNPTVLIEVLSSATEGRDRGFKAAQYRTIESVQEYVLVSQTEPRVEIYLRQLGGKWLLTEATGMEEACRFESIDCTIAVKDVYDKVTFDNEDASVLT